MNSPSQIGRVEEEEQRKELIMSFKDANVNIMIEAELYAPLPAVLFHLNQCKV